MTEPKSSFIPGAEDRERKRLQAECEKMGKQIGQAIDGLAAQFPQLGEQVLPNEFMVFVARFEHLVDYLMPKHEDPECEDEEPTSLERLNFEHGWHARMLDIARQHAEGVKIAMSKQLHVPTPTPDNVSLFKPKGG